jgi:hypothetical protein
VGVNFFQQHWNKRTEESDPAAIEPPALPQAEKTRPADTIIPIQVSDAEYVLLMHALCPTGAPVYDALEVDVPESNVPAVVDTAGQPPPASSRAASPDRPPGTPII